jgi:hypothetical protein
MTAAIIIAIVYGALVAVMVDAWRGWKQHDD